MNNEMPQEQSNKKLSTPLTVAGFVAAIALIAWVSVQIIQFIPNSFSSLASLAQGISNYRESMSVNNDEPLSVASDTKLTTVGKPVVVTWKKDVRGGTYVFSYTCEDGVSVEIVDDEGLRQIACDTKYSLGEADSVTLMVESLKKRHVDVSYTIAFLRPNDTEASRNGTSVVTITNTAIAEEVAVAEPDGQVLGEDAAKPETKPEETPAPAPKPAPTKPVVVTEPKTEYVYTIPVSNPNGYTDLATRFLNVGDIAGGKFVAGSIERDGSGAFQFEVKNIGTKTSGEWTYTVTLPDGDAYTSLKQTALKPNERAVISLGFDTPDKASHTFVVVVKIDDKNVSNNSFKKVVNFVK
jgi:hypothetical protein